MFWTKLRLIRLVCCGFIYLALMVPWTPVSAADESAPVAEIWLISYGPGEIYWQRYGHNAIWVRDADLGLDHVFNFGF
jgi:hypothetical protein